MLLFAPPAPLPDLRSPISESPPSVISSSLLRSLRPLRLINLPLRERELPARPRRQDAGEPRKTAPRSLGLSITPVRPGPTLNHQLPSHHLIRDSLAKEKTGSSCRNQKPEPSPCDSRLGKRSMAQRGQPSPRDAHGAMGANPMAERRQTMAKLSGQPRPELDVAAKLHPSKEQYQIRAKLIRPALVQ